MHTMAADAMVESGSCTEFQLHESTSLSESGSETGTEKTVSLLKCHYPVSVEQNWHNLSPMLVTVKQW